MAPPLGADNANICLVMASRPSGQVSRALTAKWWRCQSNWHDAGCRSINAAQQVGQINRVQLGRRTGSLRHAYLSLVTAVLCVMTAATVVAQTKDHASNWTPKRTAWGDPDLQGVWTSDDSIGVPLERPKRYGKRKLLTDEEYAERSQENNKISSSVLAGVNPHVGYWEQHEGVDAEPYSSNWTEYARQTSRQTSLIVDPEDGHFPPLTPQALYQRMASIANVRKKLQPESWEDLSMNARCITRGVLGSMLPVIYGNGTDILQAPGLAVIRNEMIHETRIVPIDPPAHPGPHLPAGIRMYMGDPRGHWEGNTLVVESTNFIGGRVGIGENGDGLKYSDDLHLIERFTRTSDSAIQYEVMVHDPKTFTASWTVAFPISRQPGYQIFEYACHEGNYAVANILSEARAAEKADAATK